MSGVHRVPSEATRMSFATIATPVFVATDGQERSDGAVRAAFALAGDHTEVRLIAVLPALPIMTPEAPLPITPEVLTERRNDLQRDIASQIERVGRPECSRVVVDIEDGDPATMISRAAGMAKAQLIVAGLGRHRMIDRLFGAETTLSLMRTSSVPVLAVGPQYAGAPVRIVVAADFSEPSVRAAQHAISIAGANAEVDLVHVAPTGIFGTSQSRSAECERAANASLDRMEGKLKVAVGIRINRVLLHGDPAVEILRYAGEVGADLIATGSHGHGFITRMLIGSVATKIVRASAFAVLTVPHAIALRHDGHPTELTSILLLPRDDWDTLLDHFSRRNEGRPVVLEVEDPEIGARAQEHGYPLSGVSYDRHDHQVHVMLGALGDYHRHLTRNIGDVTSMDLITDDHGRDLELRISHGAGETILGFAR